MLKDNRHEFALFYSDLLLQKDSDVVSINDTALVSRITSVLRLKPQDALILFDQMLHAQVLLKDCSRKSCSFSVIAWHKNQDLEPEITVLLPVLKRDALESAIYSCVALGASVVQLVTTEKTRKWQGEKELHRLQRIIIAAAEQSKFFTFPDILAPLSLEDSLTEHSKCKNKLFADPEGDSYLIHLSELDKSKDFLLCVGPEGDLTISEKKLLQNQFIFCELTPTILKSEQALALMVGVVRIAT